MKSRMLVSMLVIALAAAVIGGATMAWFTDAAATDEVTFQAGTLMVDVDNPELAEACDVNLERLNPGDCMEWEFDVKNVGTKSANWLLYMCYQDTIGQDNDALGEGQQADLVARNYGTNGLSEVLEWTITVDDEVVYSGELEGAPFVLDELDAFGVPGEEGVDSSKKVVVTACLPDEETGNEYQGGKMDILFGVKAWQTTNDAPAPGVTEEDCPWGEVPPAETYTVTFVSNGGSDVDPVTGLDSGDVVDPLAAPSWEGFTFEGWYEDDVTFEIPFTKTSVVTGNITVYAKWAEVVVPPAFYNVSVDICGTCGYSNYGTVKIVNNNQTTGSFEEGTSVEVKATPGKYSPGKYYKFDGWYTTSNCTEGTKVSTSRSYTFELTSDTSLYAKFTK